MEGNRPYFPMAYSQFSFLRGANGVGVDEMANSKAPLVLSIDIPT